MWWLNDMLLNNHWITEETKGKIKKKNVGMNENGSTTVPNIWDEAKAVIKRKFIRIQFSFKKQEKLQINSLSLTPKTTRERRSNKT